LEGKRTTGSYPTGEKLDTPERVGGVPSEKGGGKTSWIGTSNKVCSLGKKKEDYRGGKRGRTLRKKLTCLRDKR